MKIKDFEKKMNAICPLELQEEWDNSGLQINASESGKIEKVLVALEVSQAVVDEAKSLGVDMIVTHHPLFFGSFRQIVPDFLPTRYAIDIIKSGISVYSAHTNFDIMEGGNNDYLAKLLGFKSVESHGILRSGKVSKKATASDIAKLVSDKLDIKLEMIRLIGNPNAPVKKVAWCTGAGADFIMDSLDLGADLFITGDIKYHEATTIKEFGLNSLDIGHFGSEKIFTPNMTSILKKAFPKLTIIASKMDQDPFDVAE